MKIPTALIVSDLQSPATDPRALDFLRALRDEIRPGMVLAVGDEIDHTALSRFATNPNLPSAADEFKQTKEFLDELEAIFPTLYLAYSNHGARLWKKAEESGIPGAWIKSPQEAFDKPGWTWAADWWIEGRHGPVCVTHGDRKKGAFNYAKTLGASVFSGHQHSMMGIQWQNSRHQTIFGCDVGCLADVDHLAMKYAREAPLGQMMGCAALIDGLPRLFYLD